MSVLAAAAGAAVLASGLVPMNVPGAAKVAAAAEVSSEDAGDAPVTAPPLPPAPGAGVDLDIATSVRPVDVPLEIPDPGVLGEESVGTPNDLTLTSPTDLVEVAQPTTAQVEEIEDVQAASAIPGVEGEALERVEGEATGKDGLAVPGDQIRVESLGELPVDAPVGPSVDPSIPVAPVIPPTSGEKPDGPQSPAEPAQTDGPDVWGIRLSRESGDLAGSGVARVRISYDDLVGAYGADFASRLQILVYPSCIMTTPEVPECQQGVPLDTFNDPIAQTVEATVPFTDAATGDLPIDAVPADPATPVDPSLPAAPVDPAVPAAPSAVSSAGPSASVETGAVRANLVKGALRSAVAAAPMAAPMLAATANDGGGPVLGITAGAFGPAGNYGATDLKPSGEWASGGSSGSFTYSFPVPVAPSVAGAAPSLVFQYDSGSVDGTTTASNSQGSWVGRGWDLSTGFIERRYVSCNQDGHPTWGDLCWHSPYASRPAQAAYVFSLGGSQTELILDPGESPVGNVYRAKDDNGWRFFRTTSGGGDNPDNDKEAWRVESPDGTIYWFGKSALSVTSPSASTRLTNSVATVPVYHDADEPGGSGWRTQAYRWMLDQVIDIHENSISYVYELETNRYRKHSTGESVDYVAAVYPQTIYYGEPSDGLMAEPPARISFATSNRCIASNVPDPWTTTWDCATITDNVAQYPDVPADLICGGTCSSARTTPSFFNRERLNYILSEVKQTDGSGYDKVYRTQARFAFPKTDDGTASSLWLDWLQVQGYQGDPDLRLPAVNFGGAQMRNRVDYTGSVKPLDKRRIVQIENDTGGKILVDYNGPSYAHACPQGGSSASGWSSWYSGVDGNWDHNDNLCYPVLFDPDGEGGSAAGFGIFHKYVVTSVRLDDLVGTTTDEVWNYQYVDAPAWAYHDDIISDIPSSKMPQTWDVFRGYHQVVTTHGAGANPTITATKYFDGMDADHNADNTTKSSSYNYFDGAAVTNSKWLAGAVMETESQDENGIPLARTKYTYTKQRELDGPGWHNAVMRRGRTTYTETRIIEPDVPDTWRQTQSSNYWTNEGLINRVNNSGELGVADNQCTDTSYARNVSALTAATLRYVILPDDVVTYENPTACDDTSVAGEVVAHATTYYDGSPDRAGNANVYDGNPTKTRVYTATDATPTSVYSYAAFDSRGRLTQTQTAAQEAADKQTQIQYNTAASGYPGSIVITGPTGATSTLNVSRWHSNPNSVKDANDNYTWIDYDPFGRVTQVDKTAPGTTGTTNKANRSLAQTYTKITYPNGYAAGVTPTLSNGAPLGVTTTSLVKGAGAWPAAGVTTNAVVQSSTSFVDGFGRLRQTHVASPQNDGSSIVTVNKYDSRGMLSASSSPTWFSNAPGSFLNDAGRTLFKSYTEYDYDNLERPSATLTYSNDVLQYQSTTIHRGNRSVTTAPGGAKTTTWFDARGRTTSSVQEISGSTTAATTYAYDAIADVGTKVTVTAPPTTSAGTASVTKFYADTAGRRTKVEDSDAGTTTTSYNSVGQPTTVTTPTGEITSTFDVLDRKLTETVKNASNATVQTNSWVYDTLAKGQLTSSSSTTTNGGAAVTTAKSVAGYDNLYRPTAQTQTVTFNPTTGLTAINNLAVTNQFTYDAAGNVLTTTHPALGGLPEPPRHVRRLPGVSPQPTA